MKITVLLLLAVFHLNAQDFASSNAKRFAQTYEQAFQNREMRCHYHEPDLNIYIRPINATEYTFGELKRSFSIITEKNIFRLDFKLLLEDGDTHYQFFLDSVEVAKAPLKSNEQRIMMDFGYDPFLLGRSAGFKNNWGNTQIDPNKIKCNLEFAKSKDIVLGPTQHLRVHPHNIYDSVGATQERGLQLSKEMPSYVLVEAPQAMGWSVNLDHFLRTGSYSLNQKLYYTSAEIMTKSKMSISPVGYNDYQFEGKNIEVFYTGGNHNYCILNNTRSLIRNLFYSDFEGELTINYMMDGAVVQRKNSWFKALEFTKRDFRQANSQLLSKLFTSDPQRAMAYTKAYSDYFKDNFFQRFKGLYKTLRFQYSSDYYSETVDIEGNGERELTINLRYL